MAPNQRFDSHVIAELERGISTGYNLNHNLSLLKLYVAYPSRRSAEVVGRILSSALVQHPSVDFQLCLYLIPTQYIQQIKGYIDAAALLETGAFAEFWLDIEKTKILNAKEKDDVRLFVSDILAQTHSAIDVKVMCECLDQKDVDELAKKKGWTIKDGRVLIPRSTVPTFPKARKN